jgi:hypothetical protein
MFVQAWMETVVIGRLHRLSNELRKLVLRSYIFWLTQGLPSLPVLAQLPMITFCLPPTRTGSPPPPDFLLQTPMLPQTGHAEQDGARHLYPAGCARQLPRAALERLRFNGVMEAVAGGSDTYGVLEIHNKLR